MQSPARRTPRACEHCRHTRRRCEPPYPCRQCVELGITCDVRDKARPQRQLHAHQRTQTRSSNGHPNDRSTAGSDEDLQTSTRGCQASPSPGVRRRQRDTYELLSGLVHDMLLERHGTRPHAIHQKCINSVANTRQPTNSTASWLNRYQEDPEDSAFLSINTTMMTHDCLSAPLVCGFC